MTAYRRRRQLLLAALMTGLWQWPAGASGAEPTWTDVAPLFARHCHLCHAGDHAAVGLRLDSLDGLKAGSQRGPVVIAGDAAGSELIRRLTGESQPRMPLTGPPFLADTEIDLIGAWVTAGMPAGEAPDSTPAEPAPQPPVPGPQERVTWTHVAPILARRCAKCHSDDGLMGAPPEGFRVTAWGDVVSARERLRIVAGNPGASELVRRIRGQSRPRMPFDGPPWLDETEITLIERWVDGGAADAEGNDAPASAGARLRLGGTLGDGWTLDGLPLTVGAGTRIDKAPRPGDFVEVRGRLDSAGQVVVERLRRR